MPRPKGANPKNHQIQVRVTDEEMDILLSIAHLETVTVNAFVRSLVEREIHRVREDPAVVADRENRRRYAERKAGDPIPLSARTKRSGDRKR